MRSASGGRSGVPIGRRALVGGALGVGASVALGCKAADRSAPPAARSAALPLDAPADHGTDRWTELRFAASAGSPDEQLALVLAERERPLLVALHGRGEALRGLEAGARGWRDDYELERADRRLRSPPLREADLLSMVRSDRLDALNDSLRKAPYEGLAVACPYTPDLPDRRLEAARPFATFVVEQLIPRVQREIGTASGREHTGIDGVSLGGRYALLIGLGHPELFGAIGALQPAVREAEARDLALLARRAADRGLGHLRLVTSDDDYFRPAVEALSAALSQQRVRHELLVTPGPHDYAYNRGPGAFEMLLWHERVLRALPAP